MSTENTSAGNDGAVAGDDAGDSIQLQIDADPVAAGRADLAALRDVLRRVIAHVGLTRAALSIVVVGDETMSRLHGQFANDPTTTDVLTFDLREEDAPPDQPDGEIYICIDEAERRAAELGHAPAAELALYATHGLLHLLGHDDHDPQAYERMHEREDQLLRSAGVGEVFHKHQPVAGGPASHAGER